MQKTIIPEESGFLLRRLHSLTGIVPLTGFIFFHFFENAYSTKGAAAYNETVEKIRGLPFLTAIEWGLLLSPFLFHMLFGMWIMFSGRSNVTRQNYGRNWAYLFQRISAAVVLTFIIYHVVGLRFLDRAPGAAEGRPDFFSYLRDQMRNPWVYTAYVLGIGCAAYHAANGICTFCMTWGITIGRTAQRYTAVAMAAFGLVAFVMGLCAINGFNSHKTTQPSAVAKTAEPVASVR